MLRRIEQYQTSAGRAPYRDWINRLKDQGVKARIFTRLDRLSLGNFGKCKALGPGISELKINYGPGYRIYFAEEGAITIILLCGGDKGAQKKDIEKARCFLADYRSRR